MDYQEAIISVSRSHPNEWTQEMREAASRAYDLEPEMRSDLERALLDADERYVEGERDYWYGTTTEVDFQKPEYAPASEAAAAFQYCREHEAEARLPKQPEQEKEQESKSRDFGGGMER